VHLDRVAGLGDFLELEVVLEDHEPSEAGMREAHELMAQLGVDPSQLVEGAYVDLLGAAGQTRSPNPCSVRGHRNTTGAPSQGRDSTREPGEA